MTRVDAMEPTPRRRRQRLAAGALPSAWLASPERFYAKLQQILEGWRYDRLVDGLCARFYDGLCARGAVVEASTYFRLLMIGLFEGIDSAQAIAWRVEDSGVLRCFLGAGRPERVPDVTQVARTRLLIDAAMHEEVFHWVLTVLNDCVTADATDRVSTATRLDGECLPWARVRGYRAFLDRFLGASLESGPMARACRGDGRDGEARRGPEHGGNGNGASGRVH